MAMELGKGNTAEMALAERPVALLLVEQVSLQVLDLSGLI